MWEVWFKQGQVDVVVGSLKLLKIKTIWRSAIGSRNFVLRRWEEYSARLRLAPPRGPCHFYRVLARDMIVGCLAGASPPGY
jgi:hypothetical protein